jgi:NAD(P)-dependent dehydrogenase (short-subunit alcohol dehydrogenase family)
MKKGIPSPAPKSIKEAFDLTGRVAVITGGAGLLGIKHSEVIAELGGVPILVDLDKTKVEAAAKSIAEKYETDIFGWATDITSSEAVEKLKDKVMDRFGRVDILINNAANNPSVSNDFGSNDQWTRLEQFPMDLWEKDIAVGLTGSFLCSRTLGAEMAGAGRGVILNIGSDLGLIAPDQRLYEKEGSLPDEQPVKPVTYSVVKSGLIGLTRYLATYWADRGVRANLIAPGGVYTDQDHKFVEQLSRLIPLGRMAHHDEYKSSVAFLVSDASSYMNGAVLSVDGGRSCW